MPEQADKSAEFLRQMRCSPTTSQPNGAQQQQSPRHETPVSSTLRELSQALGYVGASKIRERLAAFSER